MESDIEKEAKERRERRSKSGRRADDSLLPSLTRSQEVNHESYVTSYRRSRIGLTDTGTDVRRSARDLTIEEQPSLSSPKRISATPRRITYSTTPNKTNTEPLCLPFIECQLNGVKIKALLNSCVLRSIMNKNLHKEILGIDENKFVPSAFDIARGVPQLAHSVPITIASHTLHYDFQIRGNIPDVVLGLDFLTAFNCTINFGAKTLNFLWDGKLVSSKFLNDKEILSKSKDFV